MDEAKLQCLINMSIRYLYNKLEDYEKKRVEEISKSLFYQTFYEDLPSSEFNKQIRLFAVMAMNFIKDKPMSPKKIEDLQEMIEYMQSSIIWPVQHRTWRLSYLARHSKAQS